MKNCLINRRKMTLPNLWKRCLAFEAGIARLHLAIQALSHLKCAGLRHSNSGQKLKLPHLILETWLKKYNLQGLEEKLKKDKGKGTNKKGAHVKPGSGRPLSYPKCLDDELGEWVLQQRDLQRPVSVTMLHDGKSKSHHWQQVSLI